jgi:hypothetical protein
MVTCLRQRVLYLTTSRQAMSTPNSSTCTLKVRSCLSLASSRLMFADGHIKCYAAKCTVTMEDIADQLETMLDGSVIEIVIE